MIEVDRGIPLARESGVAPPQQSSTATELEVGSVGEAAAGAGALILAILGLLGVLPFTLTSVAAIVLGVGLLLGGATLARRYARAVPSVAMVRGRQEVAGALGLQALAGVAGIVLGILALLGVAPALLLSVAVLVLGTALMAAGGGMARLARSARWLRGDPLRATESEGVYAAAGWEALIGIGAVVLGILALTGHSPLTLALVAMLSIGAAMLVGGSLVAARLFSFFG